MIAMRHRTRDDRLILPAELPPESGTVWFRDGRAEDVLAELLDPDGGQAVNRLHTETRGRFR